MANSLPGYLKASVPNSLSARAPWYKNTAPAYFGIFLWFPFYLTLAQQTLPMASLAACLLGLVAAGLLCFGLYYYAPAMLGMQTGRTLYIVGTSTFGTQGGYFMPGLLMGVLQVGWFAVATYFATDYILRGLHSNSRTLFIVVAVIWAYLLAWVAIKGIAYVARVAQILNWVPLAMVVIVFAANFSGLQSYQAPASRDDMGGFLMMLAIVIGFFATAGAAGSDFGLNNRNRADVAWGGLIGIAVAIVVAGGLPVLSVAGHVGLTSAAFTPANLEYSTAVTQVGALASAVFFLFAAASVAPTCFCTFIASNSFATMLPKIPRSVSTVAAVTVGMLLAVTGVAQNLIGFFTIVGASFGPICGAMAADYILAGYKWSGPRKGINWAGYIAWALGFLVGVLPQIPGVPAGVAQLDRPAPLLSFVVGFVAYWVLAKVGVWPPVVPETELVPAAT
ncbi:MAG TPA: cytosine permease [Terriglobia bacterium]|nr:cytosine permease [Terriglobia bacterium]